MTDIKLPKVHPGEILREEYLAPYDLSAGKLAKLINVPRTRIERLASESTSVTSDTACRLAAIFDTTPAFWMGLQSNYDLLTTADEIDVSDIEPLTLRYA